MKKTLLPLSFVLSSVLLAGCALLNTQNFSPPEQIAKREANMSSAIFADDGITTIKIPNLKMDSDTQNDTFPKAKIPTFDITESGLVPALSKIAKRAGITLTIKGSFSDALSASATIENLGGDIQNVLDKLASTYGFWYEYKKNSLTIYPQKKFTVELPAAIYTDLFAGMANTISTIGAQDISLDRNNRTVTYTANRTVQTEIEKYFKHVEATRTIIAYDVVIYRVELNNADQTGIKWNQLQYTEPAFKVGLSGGFADSIPGAGAVSFAYSHARVAADVLFQFLQTQGTVRTVSQPKMMMLSGAKGSFRQGRTTTYVSKTGTNYSASVNTVSVETDKTSTGINLDVYGEISDNTIFSHISLSSRDLLSMQSINIQGTSVQLPDVAEREVKTEIRCKAGDLMVIGGIIVDEDSSENDRLFGKMPTYNSGTSKKSELVIFLKPRLIKFEKESKGARIATDKNDNVDAFVANYREKRGI